MSNDTEGIGRRPGRQVTDFPFATLVATALLVTLIKGMALAVRTNAHDVACSAVKREWPRSIQTLSSPGNARR